MRRIQRVPLPAGVQADLDRRAAAIGPEANISKAWKAARQTRGMAQIMRTLQRMAGATERCMYCVDSHGSDIEHFWPKARFPGKAFAWPNMLLCCTECGRLKGDQFPLSPAGQPMLVDPSAEDPWAQLDFDPDTGNLTARFDPTTDRPSDRGACTVEVLHLDTREGMAAGYRRTWLRLAARTREALLDEQAIAAQPAQFALELQRIDDHGLLPWCVGPVGCRVAPFDELKRRQPALWQALVDTAHAPPAAPPARARRPA